MLHVPPNVLNAIRNSTHLPRYRFIHAERESRKWSPSTDVKHAFFTLTFSMHTI
jgi:hypothetical protein